MKKFFAIAEAGVNYNGSLNLAKKLINVVVEAKVDALKFQIFRSELCLSKTEKKAKHEDKNIHDSVAIQYKIVKKLELSERMHHEVASLCMHHNL